MYTAITESLPAPMGYPYGLGGSPSLDGSTGGHQGAAGRSGGARVFVVEDETLIVMELTDRLETLGYHVCGTAGRVDATLQKMGEAKPDIVLMDIHLSGGGSGLDVAREVKARFGIPVVFLTAYTDAALIANAVEAGSYGYLIKPCDERELHAALQVALARHDFESQLAEINASLEERVRARTADLEQALKAAEEANRAKTDFLRCVNHELRSPLNHVVLLADLLGALPVVLADKQAAWCVENMKRSGQHLCQLVEQLLSLQNTDDRLLAAPWLEAVDIKQVVTEAITLADAMAAEKGVELKLDIPASAAAWVMADCDRLHQIIMNLISNAIKYNRQGGWVRVSVGVESIGRLYLSVSDNGIGMTDTQRERIFEPFVRFVPQGQVIDGIGIGLAVAQAMAGQMGSHIAVSSSPGHGTCFSVVLSRCGADAVVGG